MNDDLLQPAGAPAPPPLDRFATGRKLSRVANASVAEALRGLVQAPAAQARRIGITGPPGAGKSTLIAQLAARRLAGGGRIGVVAIDPTSPFSQGAILGDRIRMEAVADHPRLFIRSLASRAAHDGLADNLPDILATMDAGGFDEVIVETVGVGQVEYAVRTLVDTVVVVLTPESGDQVQAIKAGILEIADIYLVNKADRPGADRIAAELKSLIGLRKPDPRRWVPPVLQISVHDAAAHDAADQAIARHLEWSAAANAPADTRRRRAAYHARSLLERRLAELLQGLPAERLDCPLPELYRLLVRALAEDSGAGA
jgi:LAO/AO transport system kinase